MPVKRSDVIDAAGFTKTQRQEIDRLVALIDELLKNHDGFRTIVALTHTPDPKVRAEIEREYREAGWTISFFDDQREGAWFDIR